LDLCPAEPPGKLDQGRTRMSTTDFRIARVQRTLRWLEDDIPLLNRRVKDLSKERQDSARRFATAIIQETQAQLERLLREKPLQTEDACGAAAEPAD
jgi:hypothetical protein